MNNKKVNKKISILIIGIATLIISITGATYAYFAIGATNNNVITGTAATADLGLTVTKNLPTATNSGAIVPQLNAALGSAVSVGCVDANQNIVCEVFTIKVENKGSSQIRIKGSLHFTYTSTFSNLYWREMDSATTLGTHNIYKASTNESTVSTTSGQQNASLISSLSLTAGASKSYYVVIWLEETNTTQNTIDTGTFTGTVKFNAINSSGQAISGVTSTITS